MLDLREYAPLSEYSENSLRPSSKSPAPDPAPPNGVVPVVFVAVVVPSSDRSVTDD